MTEDAIRKYLDDPAFVAHVTAERAAQGLPARIEDEGFYRFLADAIHTSAGGPQTASKSKPKRTRNKAAA